MHFLCLVLFLLFTSLVVVLCASTVNVRLDGNFQSVKTVVVPWGLTLAGEFGPVCLTGERSLGHLTGKGKQSWYEEFKWYSSSNSYLLFQLMMSEIELIVSYKLWLPLATPYLLLKAGTSLCHSGWKPQWSSLPLFL